MNIINLNINAFSLHNCSQNFSNIEWLSLTDNKITELNKNIFIYLIKLKKNYLSHNKLKVIDSLLFNSNKKLTDIYLFNNLINAFNLDLNSLAYLKILDLKNNMLTTLQQSVFKNIFVNKTDFILSLQNNTFKCECNMNWITELDTIINIYIQISYKDVCQTYNISIHCWFYSNKHICQSINKRICDDTG